MPVNGGVSLGTASGSIDISTRGVDNAERRVKGASANITRDLGGIGKGVGGLEDKFRKFDSFFGASLFFGAGVAGARIAGETIKAASDLTESINKTSVAFASSDKDILKWSEDSAKALGQSRQQALEGASSFGLLFRTMGLAPAVTAEMSIALVQLATDMASINNISPEEALTKLRAGLVGEVEPLRTVGVLLNAVAVEGKAMEMGLATTTKAITEQDKVMARYQLILEQTALTQGDFARTSGELANKQRILAANIADSQALLGKLLVPAASGGVGALNVWLEGQTRMFYTYAGVVERATDSFSDFLRATGVVAAVGGFMRDTGMLASTTNLPQVGRYERNAFLNPDRPTVAGPRFDDDQTALIRERYDAITELERESAADRLETVRDYGQAVGDIQRDYGQTLAREAQDFATSRLRAEADMLDSITDLHRDAARREADMAEDLARTISRSQADSAERIGEAREDANERLVEMEEDYAKDRERAAEDHRDKMLSAAGRLDAIALLEERKRWARESSDAKEAHDEQRDDLQEQLQERIDDENKALAKSIANAQEAHDRQLEDAREADAEREADMLADFEARKVREDEDRALRLQRMAEDHQARLDEMARQHQLDLEQIRIDEAAERALIEEESAKALVEAGVRNDKWIKENERVTQRAIEDYDRVQSNLALMAARMVGLTALTGGSRGHPSTADPYVNDPYYTGRSPGGTTLKTVNAQINITGDGMNEREVGEKMVEVLIDWLENQ
jgi:hypothetical protein